MTSIKKLSFKYRKAFTLVEVVVVLAVISVLVGVGAVTANRYQQNARDSERGSKANIIATSLEKYYDENNEYPSCTQLTASPAAVKTTLKGLSTEDVLRAPRTAKGTNSIICSINPPSGTNTFTYTCLSTSTCAKWELKYRNETDNTVKSIASAHSASIDGSIALNPPDVSVAASVSGGTATGTASGTCGTGNINYQIRSYKNAGSFPGTWINGSSTSISPLNEGESGTFQAQARCTQTGVTASEYAQSDPATGTRPVTAPTDITISAVISGSSAVATLGGGSCAPGTTLHRQIRYNPTSTWWGGTWTNYEEIAGTTFSVPANEGWQYNFGHLAYCRNETTGVSSAITWGGGATATRSISAPGAPAVYAAGSAPRIRFTWSPSGCPTGTSPEYRWLFGHNGGYSSDWWGPSTGTLFDWNDTSEGFTFHNYVQQRCNSGVVTGAWSGNGYASYFRPVDAPPAPGGFTNDRAGTGGISFAWNTPACGWSTQAQWRMDWVNGGGTGIRWINSPTGREDGWWFGSNTTALSGANPSTGWSAGWPSFGFMGDRNNPYSVKPPRMNLDTGTVGSFDADNYIGIAVEYRCVNTTTGVAGPVGGKGMGAYKW